MTTIESGRESVIEIKKSKFISVGFGLKTIGEIKQKIEEMKKTFADAHHVCYAYKIDNIEASSDDGEPSGTAGHPILNVIKKNNLTNVLIVVIRYFGGIKLGAGPLLRAYSNSAEQAVLNSKIKTLEKKCEISFEIDFEKAFNVYLMVEKRLIELKKSVENCFKVVCEEKNCFEVLRQLENFGAKNIEISEVLL